MDAIFPRRFGEKYPYAARAEGVYIWDNDGKKYLDACGGAAVVSIGHGVREVVERIHSQASVLAYAHTTQFHTRVGAELAQHLRARFPGAPQNVLAHFTSGGSEATETAIKIVRQYWISRGESRRYKILSRWHSYHGATMGALALSGNRRRREPYLQLLADFGHVAACYCYRCPLNLEYPGCELACARELETMIQKAEPETVAAFILEPVVGAASGAAPPDGYLRTVREICDKHGILMIADEVMTGGGRTGTYFAVEHWNVVPDIILLGKGLSSGYMPLGAVLVSEEVWQRIAAGPGTLDHGFTYQGHPPSLAAGIAVQRYIETHGLVERARKLGEFLSERLECLRKLPCVGDVRGKGLLQTVEFVADKKTRQPFAAGQHFGARVFDELRDRGALVYAISGAVDGALGDHLLIAPPFVIKKTEIDWFVGELQQSIERVYQGLTAPA